VFLFNFLVWGEPLNSGLRNVASKNYKHHSIMWCTEYFDTLNFLGINHQCDRRNYDSNSMCLTMPAKTQRGSQQQWFSSLHATFNIHIISHIYWNVSCHIFRMEHHHVVVAAYAEYKICYTAQNGNTAPQENQRVFYMYNKNVKCLCQLLTLTLIIPLVIAITLNPSPTGQWNQWS